MGLTTAERNRRKRERKKREREEQRKKAQAEAALKEKADAQTTQSGGVVVKTEDTTTQDEDIQIDYIAEPAVAEGFDALRRFQERAATSSVRTAAALDQEEQAAARGENPAEDDDDDDNEPQLSNRKLRDMIRPTVAELKRRVRRPDLVEAHDVTAANPEFLIQLKGVPGTVPVPRHWGRKRKYLQGKRGFEKPPFQLPEFITRTGITEIRDTVAEDEASMSARQKNRARVAPKMGAIDLDYRTLHDAFFKHQTKPTNLTRFGDIYYEGKELEANLNVKPGGPLSDTLRDALGMTSDTSPPPWLVNMQRYGPPPSFPGLKIPGLNAPLPSPECQYGYHPNGWGKPPVDAYGRPLYGGNPFDPPGSSAEKTADTSTMVTSDGKTVSKLEWGALPTGDLVAEEESEEEESSSDEEMSESDEEEEDGATENASEGVQSVLPPPPGTSLPSTAPGDLRKQAGDETPLVGAPPTKQLYQVIEEKRATSGQNAGSVFASEVAYVVPGSQQEQQQQPAAAPVPEGAESVLAKGASASLKRKRKDDDDEDELSKNFKF